MIEIDINQTTRQYNLVEKMSGIVCIQTGSGEDRPDGGGVDRHQERVGGAHPDRKRPVIRGRIVRYPQHPLEVPRQL